MVAKAATKSGEFFCFHCGKQVTKQSQECESCGVTFDKMTDAFRCPRCSNLLPVGAAACPACGLGFKVRTISTNQKPSEDDLFLMKLIDWGKTPEQSAGQPKPITRTVKAGGQAPPPPPPPPPPVQRKVVSEPTKPMVPRVPVKGSVAGQSKQIPTAQKAAPVKRAESEVRDLSMREPPQADGAEQKTQPVHEIKKQILHGRGSPDVIRLIERLEEAEANLQRSSVRNIKLLEALQNRDTAPEEIESGGQVDFSSIFDQLRAEINEITLMEGQLKEIRDYIHSDGDMPSSIAKPEKAQEDDGGLSNLALKNLLDERDKEIKSLKDREDELSRKEEHINRKLREYAIKKQELEALEKQKLKVQEAVEIGSAESELEMPDRLEVDDKGEWLKEQARIKSGLMEMRKQLGPSKKQAISYIPTEVPGDIAERVEVLEEKLEDVTKERDELATHVQKLEESRSDVVNLLKVLDQLLGKLPADIIDEFSNSKEFKLYEKVLDDLNI